MTELIAIITTYSAIIGPALTSIIGAIILFLKGVKSMKKAADDISSHKEIQDLVNENKILQRELNETNRSVKLLTDKIAKIEGYSDTVLHNKDRG